MAVASTSMIPNDMTAGRDAKISLLDAHLKALAKAQKMQHAQGQHRMNVAGSALGLAAAASNHAVKVQQRDRGEQSDV